MNRWTNKYHKLKPVLTQEELIIKMKNRWLIIKDSEIYYIKNHLNLIWYYRISLYAKEFYKFEFIKWVKIIKDEFIENTTFKDIIELYNFDRKLRILVLNIIEKFENSFKSFIIEALTQKNKNFFEYVYYKKTYKDYNTMFKVRNDIINNYFNPIEIENKRTNKHFYIRYSNEYLPINYYVQSLTFWWLKNFYNSLHIKHKIKILSFFWLFKYWDYSKKELKTKFNLIEENNFKKDLFKIMLIRNIVSHHDILFSNNINWKKFNKCLNLLFKYKHLLFPYSHIDSDIKNLYEKYIHLKPVKDNFYN